jgi:hypothetical protein
VRSAGPHARQYRRDRRSVSSAARGLSIVRRLLHASVFALGGAMVVGGCGGAGSTGKGNVSGAGSAGTSGSDSGAGSAGTSGSDSGAGSAGASASGSGGATGSAGSGQGSGASAGTSAAGMVDSGHSSSGGGSGASTGAGGDAGTGQDSGGVPDSDASTPTCPASQPAAGVTCPSTTTGYCYYSGGRICSCDPQGGIPGPYRWDCGMTPVNCPTTVPKDGDSCTGPAQRCSYDFRACASSNPSAFVCSGGVVSGFRWVAMPTPCG